MDTRKEYVKPEIKRLGLLRELTRAEESGELWEGEAFDSTKISLV